MIKKQKIFYSFYLCIFCIVNTFSQSADIIIQEAQKFYETNNYPQAQERYLEALNQAEAEKKPLIMARASLALARSHYYLYDHEASLKWSYKTLQIVQKHKLDSLLAQAYYFLGVLYIEDERVDSTEKYSFKAIELMLKAKDYIRLSQTYSTLAELYINTSKDSLKIEQMIFSAEKFAKQSLDKGMMAFALSKRYNYCFFLKRNYKQALEHINKVEKLYSETGNNEAILNAYRGKAECLIMLRDTAALHYMNKWFLFKDSILQSEKAENIAKYETLYETEKKERENKFLQQENKLNRLLLLVVIIVLLLMIVLILWVYSRNNLKKQQQELSNAQKLQQEKERISRDLHDNVGGQLSFVLLSLEGLTNEQKEKREEVAKSINESVRQVIGNLRETIWAISDEHITIQDLSDKLKVYTRNIFRHSDIQIKFQEQLKNNLSMNALVGLNLFRICQEVINNAFKHSNASLLEVNISSDKNISIIIADNGKGLPADIDSDGYGFSNIKKRADETGISVHIESAVNKGVKYILVV